MSPQCAIVFDLDDTLYPEREFAFSGFRAVAAAFADDLGSPPETLADLRRLFDSEHRARVFDALLVERFGKVDRPLLDRMIETYRTHPPAITLYPDVIPVLNELCASARELPGLTADVRALHLPASEPPPLPRRVQGGPGHRLGIITDGREQTQWAKIDALSLRPRFDHIIVNSEPQIFKPDPRSFESMAAILAIPNHSCVYVADNVGKDFVAPNSLGWLTIRIARPDAVHSIESSANHGQPHHTISDLHALLPLVLAPR